MKIQQILKDTPYKLKLFPEEIIKELEERTFEKETKKGKKFYTKCIIRDKDIQLKPEEVIRQLYLKYPKNRIKLTLKDN